MTTQTMSKPMMDAKNAKALIREHLETFASDPDKFPAALALRAKMACKYSIGNQLLMMAQTGDIDVIADRIMPASQWRKLGYAPSAAPLAIWSKPMIGHVDGDGNVSYGKQEPDEDSKTFARFKLVPTFPAALVSDADGKSASAPVDPLVGEAGEVFDTLRTWLVSQGWKVQLKNVDQAGGWTSHQEKLIRIDSRFSGWDRVRVLAHESAHALMHGPDDPRPYEGDHRGDMEAEADGVAYAVLMAYGQSEAASRAVRYVAEWAKKDAARIQCALDRASSALDVIMGALRGEVVEVRKPKTSKGDNRALASWLRENDLPVRGPVWSAVKAGERDVIRLAALAA